MNAGEGGISPKTAPADPNFPQSGAILVDKPEGITSSDVVFKLKKSLTAGTRLKWGFKIGHGGTLDPFATGLMVVFYGEATKLANAYLRSRKSYIGRMRLGQQTDTADYTGRVVAEAAIPLLTLADWQIHADTFIDGDYLQTPPMYSAKKIEGQRLYHLAHEGREVEREAITKKIYKFSLNQTASPDLDFEVACESGTYVRTIAEDLAKRADTHAHLLSLRRTVSSDFEISGAVTLAQATERLASAEHASTLEFIAPVNRVGTHLPSTPLSQQQEDSLRRGSPHTAQMRIASLQAAHPQATYGLLRAEDGFPVGLVHEFKLQRILNRI